MKQRSSGSNQRGSDQPPSGRAGKGFRVLFRVLETTLRVFLLVFLLGFSGCALPPAPVKEPLRISGTVSNVDLNKRFFYLEKDGQSPRTVYWDDLTRFSSGGREIDPSDADRMLGDSVAVLAVPMGGKMVANSCSKL